MSVQKRGYSLERFQFIQMTNGQVPAIGDLKSAAGTVLMTFMVPTSWGSVALHHLGGFMQATGGAQTTAGTAAVYINGTIVQDSTPANIIISSVVTHAAGSVIETSLNNTLDANNISTAPVWPTAVAGDIVTVKVVTQGVGAGDQTLVPYILYTITPGQS